MTVTAQAPGHRPTEASATSGGLDSGLTRAASALYREHHDFVWRNARRLGCSDDWIDDAVHEVFLVATRRLPEFEGRAHPRTWLFAITFRVVQRLHRDRARRRASLRRYAEQLPPGSGAVANDEVAAQYLRYLLHKLPVAQQLVLILAELEGFTSPEIAETLEIPAGTVHSRLRAAKQRLAQAIEQEAQDDERSER
jgi:RNA polymerase sigma-70 factor (ECF subfamily)